MKRGFWAINLSATLVWACASPQRFSPNAHKPFAPNAQIWSRGVGDDWMPGHYNIPEVNRRWKLGGIIPQGAREVSALDEEKLLGAITATCDVKLSLNLSWNAIRGLVCAKVGEATICRLVESELRKMRSRDPWASTPHSNRVLPDFFAPAITKTEGRMRQWARALVIERLVLESDLTIHGILADASKYIAALESTGLDCRRNALLERALTAIENVQTRLFGRSDSGILRDPYRGEQRMSYYNTAPWAGLDGLEAVDNLAVAETAKMLKFAQNSGIAIDGIHVNAPPRLVKMERRGGLSGSTGGISSSSTSFGTISVTTLVPHFYIAMNAMSVSTSSSIVAKSSAGEAAGVGGLDSLDGATVSEVAQALSVNREDGSEFIKVLAQEEFQRLCQEAGVNGYSLVVGETAKVDGKFVDLEKAAASKEMSAAEVDALFWLYVDASPSHQVVRCSPALLRLLLLWAVKSDDGALFVEQLVVGGGYEEEDFRLHAVRELSRKRANQILSDIQSAIGFLLAHELGHIALGRGHSLEQSEFECDRFAVALSRSVYGRANFDGLRVAFGFDAEGDALGKFWSIDEHSTHERAEAMQRMKLLKSMTSL